MTDRDNITLPREVVEKALEALGKGVTFKPGWVPECEDAVTALRTALAAPRLEVTVDPRMTAEEAAAISAALAAKQPKQEPSDDRKAMKLALDFVTSKQWGTRPYMEYGVFTDAFVLAEALRTALAAPKQEQEQEPVAWLSRDAARLALWEAINGREFGNPTDDKLILDHLRQQGLWIGKVTSPVPPDIEALRRDAERYRWVRERAWFQFEFEGRYGDSGETVQELDAAIDAAMGEKT